MCFNKNKPEDINMLIHGGIDVNNKILSDYNFLNLETLKWVEFLLSNILKSQKYMGTLKV